MTLRLAKLVLLATAAPAALAADFTVNSVADAGPGSLRQAILDANAAAGADRVVFAIPGSGPHAIAVLSPLPVVTGSLAIDGYTQPGASPNTLANGWDAELRIEIDAIGAGQGKGLRVQSTAVGSEIRGLAMLNVRGVSIQVEADDAVVAGNVIGLRADGLTPNQLGHGFLFAGEGAIAAWRQEFAPSARRIRIGGPAPADRNLIAGSTTGISANANSFSDPDFSIEDVTIQNNWIGLDRTGLRVVAAQNGIALTRTRRAKVLDNLFVAPNSPQLGPLPGGGSGVAASFRINDTVVEGNWIGVDPLGDGVTTGYVPFGAGGGIELGSGVNLGRVGDDFDPTRGNVVAHSGGAGIRVFSGARRVALAGNRVIDTALGLGGSNGMSIDLELPTGPNTNDPLDADSGSNDLQNHPVLATAILMPGATTLSGALSSLPTQTFRIEFHAAGTCPANQRSQAHRFLGTTTVTTDADGEATIDAMVSPAPAGWFVAATATDPEGNTSELGPCIPLQGGIAAGTLALSAIRYAPIEFGPIVNAVVRRTGGSAGSVSVWLRSEGGTAEPGVDYTPIDTLLSWADGDATDRLVPIGVLGDTQIDPAEYFALRLLTPTGGATLGAIGGAVVVITQNLPDGIYANGFEPAP